MSLAAKQVQKLSPQQEIANVFKEIAGYVESHQIHRLLLQVEPSNDKNEVLRTEALTFEQSSEYGPKSTRSYHDDALLDPREISIWSAHKLASETKGYQALAVILIGPKEIGGEVNFLKQGRNAQALDILPEGSVAFEITIRVPFEQRFLPKMKAGCYETTRVLVDSKDFALISAMAEMQLQNGSTAEDLRKAFEIGLKNYQENLLGHMATEKKEAVTLDSILSGLSLPASLIRA